MLEESSMDRKSSGRAGSGLSKSSGSECKTKQDVASIKFPRAPRRRESPRPENARKPNPQKYRDVDKRPKPKGHFYSERDRSDIADVGTAEVGSALRQGSKKLNLNHLLNFTYSTRDGPPSNWGGARRNQSKLWSTKKHKYNKEQFLQANYQFIVKHGGDYGIHTVDPDLLVDWESIELVRLLSHEIPSCPICLYQPVAAKITRCGHIYCWACILHYLALSDKSWRKCPICYESIHKKDLKSVVPVSVREHSVNEEIEMRLMRREKGSVFAMAKSMWKDRKGKLMSLTDALDDTKFAKLLTASERDVQELVIDRERRELKVTMAEDEACPESCFIENALQLLQEREQVLNTGTVVAVESTVNIQRDDADLKAVEAAVVELNLAPGRRQIKYTSAFDEDEGQVAYDEVSRQCDSPSAVDTREIHDGATCDDDTAAFFENERRRQESTSTNDSVDDEQVATADDLDIGDASIAEDSAEKVGGENFYYFYQAADGQHIYMHALNARMLITEYGSLENCPDVIRAKIVEKEGITMNEELRRRLRYLSHLPLTCEFEVVELSFRQPVVSKRVLNEFSVDIEKRRRRRNKKARDERRRDRHIQEEENRKFGRFPSARLNLDSHYQFPECKTSTASITQDFISLPSPVESVSSSSPVSIANSASLSEHLNLSPIGSLEDAAARSGPSFAQMLRDGKARAAASLMAANQRSDGAVMPVVCSGVWGGGGGSGRRHDDSDGGEDFPAPEYNVSFGDAIQIALQKATLTSKEEPSCGKKKKGKQKKQLLFSTSMARTK